MEQYSIDVNKVLNEFDFNEGAARGDQVDPATTSVAATTTAPPMQVTDLPLPYELPGAYHQVAMQNVNCDEGIAQVLEGIDINAKEIIISKEQAHIASMHNDDMRASDQNILIGNLDSINQFYSQGTLHNNELQRNMYPSVNEVTSSSSTLPFTMHDEQFQKLLHNQLNTTNDNSNLTRQSNSFDEKLSISNVYSNFNKLLTADSSDHLVNFVVPSAQSSIQESTQKVGLIETVDPFGNNFSETFVDTSKTCSIDDLLTVKEDDLLESKRENNCSMPPRYQNILLPIKLFDSCNADKKSKDCQTNKTVNQDLQFSDLITEDNNIASGYKKPEKIVKSILDESEHIYENVHIGTDIPKAQEPDLNKFKRTYVNVNFQCSSTQCNKDFLYADVEKPNLSETTTELEVVMKKLANQFSLKKTENLNAVLQNLNSSASTNASVNANMNAAFESAQVESMQIPIQQETKSTVGCTTIDDMSEEELNKYLADLEAKERANEQAVAFYENIQADSIPESSAKEKSLTIQRFDEDANEAPIFESVTIGKLPQVPQKHLQEKAKKFPVIDYGQENIGEEMCKDFTCAQSIPESGKFSAQIRDDENTIKKSKIIHEKVRKSSDNAEGTQITAVKDWENGNCVDTTNETIDSENTKKKNSKSKNFTLQLHSDDIKNFESNVQNIIKNLDHDNMSSYSGTPIRSTETISRFSVTRNVDVNDKIGSGGKPSGQQQHVKTKCSNSNVECTENSDNHSRKVSRPQTLNVTSTVNALEASSTSTTTTVSLSHETSDTEGDKDSGRAPSPDISETSSMESGSILGKQAPFWVPDSDAPNCMLCDTKFTVVKRRHHCRACGKVLCNKCCNMRYRLEYQNNIESRVCIPCHQLLKKAESDTGSGDYTGCSNINNSVINSPQARPNPNNPMEYCSTIPPLQQLAGGMPPPPPTVMVPVGVLKREGTTKQRSEGPKSVMFSDGIRPGCDLTELDTTWDWKPPSARKTTPRRAVQGYVASATGKIQNRPPIDSLTNSYIPQDPSALPPTVTIHKGQITYRDITDVATLYNSLKNECEPPVMFAINRNLFAYVKIINLNCCVNRICWNVTSKGLACVGQDEVVFLIEAISDEKEVPKDLLFHINQIYHEATKGNTISEYNMSLHQSGNLLGSREHAGFLFIRQTLQCLQKVVAPPAPFLVGLLVHRWETPWAKVFPLRLVLRLGAEYRYYPCPLVSVRFRDAVYFEIGHTIMKVLADFRNYTYTLPKVQGLTIHMQDRTTQVRFPKNRFNQVIKGLNNSNDHVLAFASNFSIEADSHLVCMQTNSEDESTYQTQAINIQNKPRRVTGASFIVINGALKSSMGLSANSSILEDGLMVQIMPEKMEALKAALKNMQDFIIGCGRQGAPEPDEIVNIKWVENDMHFNLGVKSPIDGKSMDGIPSIRVHNGINFAGTNRFIRWTEVFIIKSDDDQPFGIHYPVDINKLSESIARATCAALVKLLDLLAAAGLTKIAVRTTIHPDNVGYEAGSEGMRLPPIYMKSLDNELIQVLQKAVQGCEETQTILELVFYVLETEI